MKLLHVVGARPNFVKLAPVYRALRCHSGIQQLLVQTGQHYDFSMSEVFFQELDIPLPDINLAVGSGTHARQTAEIMMKFEEVVQANQPEMVLVYGDVNSTLAAALVCSKLRVKIAHVEAGLRSFDRTMPEEINRLLTDQMSDLLFTPSADANANLLREGVHGERIHLVGNVMIDTLIRMLPAATQRIPSDLPDRFVLVTLHRPSNVDDVGWLEQIMDALHLLSKEAPVIFPMHPRTRSRLVQAANECRNGLRFTDPLPYLDFLALQTRASVVITDSGGIQEETTFLRIPCLTVRENTERPITVREGTNLLVGRNPERVREAAIAILNGEKKNGKPLYLWDGHAADRITSVLLDYLA